MAKQALNTLKNWFRTGLKPTQAQFWDWMDSFFHKDENIPSGQIEGLQGLLDSKMDKAAVINPEQVGPYNPAKNYVFDAQLAEYVSFSNPESEAPQFQVEAFYRLKSSPGQAGRSPESHPEFWVYQGQVLGDITIDDVIGLREELDYLRENAGGGDASSRSYTIDFLTTSIIAQDINMFGAAVIDNIIVNNIESILLTYSGGLQQVITPGVNEIAITAFDILTWEITRTNAGQLAALGIHLSINE